MNPEAKASDMATLARALSRVVNFECAIDGGANVGDWTASLSQRFAKVHSYEPNPDLAAKLRTRFCDNLGVILHEQALWHEKCTLVMRGSKHRGRWCEVKRDGDRTGDVEAVTIDSLGLTGCGLIKLDLEGAELGALRGATKTLAFKPVVIVECCDRVGKRMGQPSELSALYLESLGAVERYRFRRDRVFSW